MLLSAWPDRQIFAPAIRPATSGEVIAKDDYYEKGSLVLDFVPEIPSVSDLSSINEIDDQLKRIE